MKKRTLAIVLALVMCLALWPTAALADSDFTIENGVLTKYNGCSGAVTIPSGVTSIGDYAFEYCTGLTSVTIPDSVTSIGNSAFFRCIDLTSVTIPNSVTSIGDGAFRSCASLTSVTIPSGVTSIGGLAFCGCESLARVTGGNGLAIINCNAFDETPWLENQGAFPVLNNILFTYQGKGGAVVIPSTVTSIGEGAFVNYYPRLTSVFIPDSVTSSGSGAFFRCIDLTSVTIPNSVISIGDGAFQSCTSLTSVTIPDSVTSIGSGAFQGCTSLTSVTIPNGVTSIGESTFHDCSSLTNVIIPNSVTMIGKDAFFYCCSLASVTIPDNVTSIGGSAFGYCSNLTSVTIPDGVTSIGGGAFQGCTNLTSVTIPSGVTNIGWLAFVSCTALTDVYYSGTEAQWKAIKNDAVGDFRDNLTSATIHYNSTGPALTAQPTNDKLSVDGKDATPAAYKIGGANYFMLRDVAMLLNGTKAQFEISYDNDKKAINITTGKAYTPQGYELKTTPQPNATAETSTDAVYIDGEKAELTAYKIGGANFYGIRDLGRALGFNVGWSQDRGMFIESGKPYSDAD